MGNSPVTLDFSKAQPLTLDFSKAQPIQNQSKQTENQSSSLEDKARLALSLADPLGQIGLVHQAIGNWAAKQAEKQRTENLTAIAAGKEPPHSEIVNTFLGMLGSAGKAGGAATTPENRALAGGLALANLNPITAIPADAALVAHGGITAAMNAPKALQGNPEAAESALSGAAEAVGGAAGLSKPGVIRAGWKAIGNPMGLASTGQELLTQGISPRTSMSNFGPSLERAAGDLKAYNESSPIKNVHDLNDAIPEIKQKIWNEEVEPALKRQAAKPVDMQPVADAVRSQISDEMREFDEGNAQKLDAFADKLEKARDVTSANKLLKYANGQLESYFQKFPAARRANLMNNPETAGWEAARAELRNQFLNTMESAGEAGVRDARLRYGAFDTLQDAVERRVNVADRAKPMSLGRIVGLAAAVPTAGLSVVAGELSNYLNKPDVLVRRGVAKLE